jgi:hypothetical protein
LQWWNIFGEKLADPPLIGKVPANAGRAVSDRTLAILEKMQARTAMLVPENCDVTLLESTRDPRAMFESAVNFHNHSIAKVAARADKSGYSGGPVEGGSYNLAETQQGLFALVIEAAQRWLEGIVNRSILKRMAFYEAGADAPVPTLNLLPPSQSNKLAIAQVYTKRSGDARLSRMKALTDISGA